MKFNKFEWVKHENYTGPRLEWINEFKHECGDVCDTCISKSRRIGLQLTTKNYLYGIVAETEEEKEFFNECGDYIY